MNKCIVSRKNIEVSLERKLDRGIEATFVIETDGVTVEYEEKFVTK